MNEISNFDNPYFAAVDLGSNSFHLLVARVNGGFIETVDREKEMVQLAQGLQEDGNLSVEVRERALACLSRFSERLRDLPAAQVRVVGTKTLRDADAAGDFLEAAERTLGYPIAIISGYEEARLVYSGLSHSVVNDNNQRLVIDIGGASTEFIIGCDQNPEHLDSLDFGCVALTRDYLSGGVTGKSLQSAYIAVCERIEYIRATYVHHGWDMVYGTSGTVKAIAELTQGQDGGAVINAKSLNNLVALLEAEGGVTGGEFSKPRRTVLPAGIIILKAIFDEFNIKTIHVADGTLKEGLIYDTLGRLGEDDIRSRSIEKLQQQYRADIEHARRVSHLALHLWRQIEGPALPGVSRTKLLNWAAEVHEIGLGISHTGYHNHGYYVLLHGDIAGFGRYEQRLLAELVGSHRKKIIGRLDKLDKRAFNAMMPLLICLRLAIILHRGRDGIDTAVDIKLGQNQVVLSFRPDWLEQQPMTRAGLEQEARYLSAVGFSLTYDGPVG
jgi:exopolyphosphatase/guanosine-5'-triphosphate,3'-diphosphate pyrophosphatase